MRPHPYQPPSTSTIKRLCTLACVLLALIGISLTNQPVTATRSSLPHGYSPTTIDVKFRDGSDVDLLKMKTVLPRHLANSITHGNKVFNLPKDKLDKIRDRGRSDSKKKLPDLNLWFRLSLKPGTDPVAFLADLRGLPGIEIAEPAPLPQVPPAITPDFTASQGYLDAAPGGIDARFSWTLPNGNGTGITIYDVEYSWNQSHEDLSKIHGISLLLNPGDSAVDPFSDNNHGTAVVGELVADNDTKGVTGISWGADVGLAPANTANLGYNPANAILLAVADGSPGDVILIEQQTPVCGLADFGPSEWISSVFDAIQTATANRFVVVEAAGNGNVNLDQAACGTTFNRSVRDSGAIIVGAGMPPSSGSDRQRESFSTYGSRVDLQGWGSGVQTTGYGTYIDPDDPSNPNFWYTSGFSGTSSASPIVSGAVANLQAIAINRFGTPLTPFEIRQLLVETGSAQSGTTTEHIGPRPNLKDVFTLITAPATDIFILVDTSGSFFDDLPNFKAQVPSIISTLKASNPNTRFGLGSFEDYPISPFGDASSGDVAYRRDIDLTFDTAAVEAVISGLFTRSGLDLPQSQLPALYQAASGSGQDLSGIGFPGASIPAGQQANFRNGATKLFLLWTDAAFHLPGDPGAAPYPGPTFAETVAAILALDPPKVIGISSGGVVVCTIAASGAGIGSAIIAIVQAAAEPLSITVDVKPGGGPNCIQPTSRGVISVAVLGSSVDVTKIDLATIQIDDDGDPSTAGVRPQRSVFEDVDGDGSVDLVLKFRTQDLNAAGMLLNGNSLFVTGGLTDGQQIRGSDGVLLASSCPD